jgi:uncharacterized membrane protein YkvI
MKQQPILDKEGQKDLQKIINISVLAFVIIVLIVVLYTSAVQLLGNYELPLWIQGIIMGIVALFIYSVKDYFKKMIEKYLKLND